MKFNYLTIGTNKLVEVDTDNLFISNESKAFGEKLLSKIIKGNGEKVKILDGIWVEGWIEKNIFEIAIVDGNIGTSHFLYMGWNTFKATRD